jgi:uncharacterized protein (DUF2461 family)
MKETLRFLQDLSLNNDKVWFDANKDRYMAAKAAVETLAEELISGIRSFDDTIGPLSPKECTYRIYFNRYVQRYLGESPSEYRR